MKSIDGGIIMKNLFIAFFLIVSSALPLSAEAMVGTVALVDDDKIVVYVDDGIGAYTGATLLSPILYVQRGDTIYNIENMYGGQTWYDKDCNEELNVFVDEYWMDDSQAIEYFSSPY